MALNNRQLNSIFRFLIVGIISFSVDYCSLLIMYRLFGLSLLIATTISFLIGLSVNFSLHKYWTFKAEGRIWQSVRQATLYCLLVLLNLTFTNWFILMLADKFNFGPEITKPVATLIIMTFNYVVYQKLIFRPDESL